MIEVIVMNPVIFM